MIITLSNRIYIYLQAIRAYCAHRLSE